MLHEFISLLTILGWNGWLVYLASEFVSVRSKQEEEEIQTLTTGTNAYFIILFIETLSTGSVQTDNTQGHSNKAGDAANVNRNNQMFS